MSMRDSVPPASAGAYADRLLADAARAADGARIRLSGALNDLFRSSDSRLNDRDHATMSRMLMNLVTTIEMDIRALLVEGGMLDETWDLEAELADKEQQLAWPRLSRSRVMRDPELIGLLQRRCHEHFHAIALRATYRLRWAPPQSRMEYLANYPVAEIEEAASALLVAEARRVDRFGEPLLDRADLPVELRHRMAWWVAASLRDHMLASEEVDRETADRMLVSAVSTLLENYDAEQTIDARAFDLAVRLNARNDLNDDIIAGLMSEGHIAAWVAALAVRGRIDGELVWPMVADRDGSRLTLLLRAIGMERSMALGLLVDLFVARGGANTEQDAVLEDIASAFDALSIEDALAAIKPWRPADYFRRAVAGLALDEGDER